MMPMPIPSSILIWRWLLLLPLLRLLLVLRKPEVEALERSLSRCVDHRLQRLIIDCRQHCVHTPGREELTARVKAVPIAAQGGKGGPYAGLFRG